MIRVLKVKNTTINFLNFKYISIWDSAIAEAWTEVAEEEAEASVHQEVVEVTSVEEEVVEVTSVAEVEAEASVPQEVVEEVIEVAEAAEVEPEAVLVLVPRSLSSLTRDSKESTF